MAFHPADSVRIAHATQQGHKIREQLMAKQLSLESMLNRFALVAAADQIEQAVIEFEARTREERERLLLSSAAQTTDEIGLCEWYAARYDLLARMARLVTERVMPTAPIGLRHESIKHAAGAWAYSILLRGHASKWRQIAGQRTIAPRGILHQVFKSALEYKISDHILEVSVEGQRTETTVEALYVRTLLLERFASGNLSPPRLEILDNWLITWMSTLWLSTNPPTHDATLLLSIDINSETHGLTRYEVGDTADFYLALTPLQYQLERAIQSFHRGVLFPGWGIGMAFRVDEHVGVIDFLERELMMLEQNILVKSKRFSPQTDVVADVYLGLDDITAIALSGQPANLAPIKIGAQSTLYIPNVSNTALTSGAGGKTKNNANPGNPALNAKREILHLSVLDVSETGVGLVVPAAAATDVSVNDLVAVRFGAGYPLSLGVIVRKTIAKAGAERNSTIIGVNFLSRCPLLARLQLQYPPAKNADIGPKNIAITAILLSGNSAYGSTDSLVLSDAIHKSSPLLTTRFGGETSGDIFQLRLGRVRRQGKGWRMVAFDVVQKMPVR